MAVVLGGNCSGGSCPNWMFNLSLTKSSQQRKTARRWRTPIKRNIISIGCYVFCYQLDCRQTKIACWSSVSQLNQLEQFHVSFTWKNVSTLCLLH